LIPGGSGTDDWEDSLLSPPQPASASLLAPGVRRMMTAGPSLPGSVAAMALSNSAIAAPVGGGGSGSGGGYVANAAAADAAAAAACGGSKGSRGPQQHGRVPAGAEPRRQQRQSVLPRVQAPAVRRELWGCCSGVCGPQTLFRRCQQRRRRHCAPPSHRQHRRAERIELEDAEEVEVGHIQSPLAREPHALTKVRTLQTISADGTGRLRAMADPTCLSMADPT